MSAPVDFVARYLTRLEWHLDRLPRAERLPCLEREQLRWIAMADSVAERLKHRDQPQPGEHIVDYDLTIAGLGARIQREKRP